MNSAPPRPSKSTNIPDPPGFSRSTGKQVSSHDTRIVSHPLTMLLRLVTNLPTTSLHNLPKDRRYGYPEAQEVMGDRTSTRKTTSNERRYDVHVRK